jgi:hypothetical protein
MEVDVNLEGRSSTRLALGEHYPVSADEGFLSGLEHLFGEGSVELV